MVIVIPIVIVVSVAMDALYNRWISRVGGWWRWHIVKWIAVFSVWGLLTLMWWREYHYNPYKLIDIAAFAVLCHYVWRGVYTNVWRKP
jgi:hypothetical protein